MLPTMQLDERPREADSDSTETEELEERELTALLGAHADPETWSHSLRESLHALDRDNARAMLAARPGADRLHAALAAAACLVPAMPARADSAQAPTDVPARADRNARRLLADLLALRDRLDTPEPPARLDNADDRKRALEVARKLSAARDIPAWAARLGGVRAALAQTARARTRLAALVARAADSELVAAAAAGLDPAERRRALRPLAPLVRWLRVEDPRTHAALLARYTAQVAPDLERRVRAHCDTVRDAKDDAGTVAALAQLVSFVESAGAAEEDFCLRFFYLDDDLDREHEHEDHERELEPRRAGPDTRRALAALFPSLEPALLALLDQVSGSDGLGAMRVLAAVGGRALSAEGSGLGALAALAVAAKRRADAAVREHARALEDAARRAKPAPLAPPAQLEEFGRKAAAACAGGRDAELDRWLGTLADACLRGADAARGAGRVRGYHALHAALSSPALRRPALAEARRSSRGRYEAALSELVSSLASRPLAPLVSFATRVSAALAGGAREADVRFGAGVSRQELRRALAAVPAEELRRSLRSLWVGLCRSVPEPGLRAVVWRGVAGALAPQVGWVSSRLATCYAGAQLSYQADDVLRMCDEVAQDP